MAKLARRPKVEEIIDHKRTWINETLNPESTIYDPTFPKPFKFEGSQTNIWVVEELYAWVDAKIQKARGEHAA